MALSATGSSPELSTAEALSSRAASSLAARSVETELAFFGVRRSDVPETPGFSLALPVEVDGFLDDEDDESFKKSNSCSLVMSFLIFELDDAAFEPVVRLDPPDPPDESARRTRSRSRSRSRSSRSCSRELPANELGLPVSHRSVAAVAAELLLPLAPPRLPPLSDDRFPT